MKICLLFCAFLLLDPQSDTSPQQTHPPFDKVELMALELGGASGTRLAKAVQQRGVSFDITSEFVEGMKTAGAEPVLVGAITVAKRVVSSSAGAKTDGDQAKEVSSEDQAYRHLLMAAGLEHDKARLGGAEDEYRAAVQASPQNPFLHFVLGNLLFNTSRRDKATEEFRQAIELKPDFAEAHLGLGYSLAAPDQKIAEYRSALQFEPDNYAAHVALAKALDQYGEREEADKEYSIAGSLPSCDGGPRRIRVSSGVLVPARRLKVEPVYPLMAKRKHLEGVVRLHAVIGADGSVKKLDVLSGPPLLAEAATEAVSRWKYAPFVIKGCPVEVDSLVEVTFSLSRSP
ncbi:MAG: hypothetical protein DMG22_03885 [Acidobacteria bacterium]|nr:MAG: hypothetical protein DMG22_03885 [Acidobacteriota bacterium]